MHVMHTLSNREDCRIAYEAVIVIPDLCSLLERAIHGIAAAQDIPDGIVHSLLCELMQRHCISGFVSNMKLESVNKVERSSSHE